MTDTALAVISSYLDKRAGTIQAVLRAGDTGLDGRKIARLAVMAVMKNPDLQKCHPSTILTSLCVAATLGLDPTVGTGKFWLVPRWNGKTKQKECTPLIGYKGLCELALRHPRVMAINAQLVFKGEEFSVDPTSATKPIHHTIRWDVEKSEATLTHAYAICYLKGSRMPIWECMSAEQVNARRERSDSGRAGKGPWKSDYLAMARKTILRALIQGGTVPTREEISYSGMVEDAVDADVSMGRLEAVGIDTPADMPAEEPMDWKPDAEEPVQVEHTEVPEDRKKAPADPMAAAKALWLRACEAHSLNVEDATALARRSSATLEGMAFNPKTADAVTLAEAARILMERLAR